jgi:Family of unknown function (DUF5684)
MDMQSNALMALGMGVIITFAIICIAISVLVLIAYWFIYDKAGQPGWAVLIPVYNLIVLLKIVGRPTWWLIWYFQVLVFYILFIVSPGVATGALLFLSEVTCIVFAIMVTNGLSKSFGKDAGFTVGLIFLGFIFYPILGFGKATYIGPGGNPPPSFEMPDNPAPQV